MAIALAALESWAWALRLEGWREKERALPLKPFLFAWHWVDAPSALAWDLGGLTVSPSSAGDFCVNLGSHQHPHLLV